MHIGIDGLLLHGSYSGVEQAIYRLLCELSRDGGPHTYTVYVPRDFAPGRGGPTCPPAVAGSADILSARPLIDRPDFRITRLGFAGPSKLRRALWAHTAFRRRARADGVELLHGPGYLLPRGWRGPSVATVYDIIALTHSHLCTRSNVLYYRAFLPRTISQATAVIVPSEAVRIAILERLHTPEAKLHVAPLGVGEEFRASLPDEAVEGVRQRYGIDAPYFLCVGNVEPKKNLSATIRGFALARRAEGLPHQLVLAGGKAWRSDDVKQAIEAVGPNVVVQTGYVALEDLPALYAGAEALLFWSLVEGFGLPALEAMACGTPVICSDRGALPEVVGDAAIVVPIGEPADLAEAIGSLLRDPERRSELVRKGRERASRFTWRNHADTVLKVYAEVGEGIG